MSRAERRKLRPPVAASVAAKAARCSHCGGAGEITGRGVAGDWCVTVHHEPDCPRILGDAGSDREMLLVAHAAVRECYRTTSGGKDLVLELTDPDMRRKPR